MTPTPHTTGEVAYLDRPQRLGLLPTRAFWSRRDVWRIAFPFNVGFILLWFALIDLLVAEGWANLAIRVSGIFFFEGLLERYIRRRLRQRHQLATSTRSALTGDREES